MKLFVGKKLLTAILMLSATGVVQADMRDNWYEDRINNATLTREQQQGPQNFIQTDKLDILINGTASNKVASIEHMAEIKVTFVSG